MSPAVALAERLSRKQSQPASSSPTFLPTEKESEMQPIHTKIHRECGDNRGNIEISDDVLPNLPESLFDDNTSFFRPTLNNCSNVHFTININNNK